MKIDVYSNMYNEAKLLPYWLRHYETFASRLFVWDDASTDATPDLLRAHSMVTMLPVAKHGCDDSYWVNELFPSVYERSQEADWIILADADEFVYHPDLLGVLASAQRAGVQLLRCNGYAMMSDRFPTSQEQIWEEVRRGLPDTMESKWAINQPSCRIQHIKGRHAEPKHACVRSKRSGIKLLHYRYLGAAFYEARDILSVERNKMVYHYDKVYDGTERRQCPDMTRAVPLDWYAEHLPQAVDVVGGSYERPRF